MVQKPQVVEIPYYEDSVKYFTCLQSEPNPIWLDSCHPYSNAGRYDILSARPSDYLTTSSGTTTIRSGSNISLHTENPFDLVQRYLPPLHRTAKHEDEDLPFCGGALGYFGYDLGRTLEVLPKLSCNDSTLPDCAIGVYSWAIVVDHKLSKAYITALQGFDTSPIETMLDRKLNVDYRLNKSFKINKFKPNINVDAYKKSVLKIQQYIQEGDCYQANFAQRLSAQYEGDLLAPYLKVRKSLPSPFSGFIPLNEGGILCFSPERFIEHVDGIASSSPIKGTIKRGSTRELDEDNIQTLATSEKDRAENLMIVDLLRNDLSKTCTQVTATQLFEVQSFANVHHLVSTITGRLRKTASPLQLLKAAFPGGSITGAPKIRAMEIIESLESHRRNAYCGSVGYISACGRMDTNIIIRSLLCDKGKIHCWGGGGIVADSKVESEYEESLTKITLLMKTLEGNFST